ncbi:Tn3 family transposase [Sinorhizobium terangae]|uniref:Tn3 family transposase n=1 Tax=Sinorhizobium terangae TaxID=110322 RepID=UPI0024B13F3C|nr:Tn3 family transposase [Sinorhizobium terangae]WFU51535.1 Tn3 family transposase [Sinorhizobium terangae]
MARRTLLSEAWWNQATAIPDDERDIVKHYTLERADLDLIMRQNRAPNRLGLACVLAMLRYPGRPLADREVLPEGVLRYLARQIGVDHREIHKYFERPQTRREHLALVFERTKTRPFASSDVRALTGWLTPAAQTLRRADALAEMVVEELRRRHILLPARAALETIIHVAIRRGLRIAHRALAGGLSESQKLDLDRLLDMRAGTTVTTLAWIRAPALSPNAANLDRIAEQVQFLRSLALPANLAERIPAKLFEELASEGMRMSAQHLRDLNPERRYAVLAATILHLSRNLTDCAIDMFKKLIGALTRRADNQAAKRVTRSVRELQKPLKDVSQVCHAIIKAREAGEDVGLALERVIRWPEFVTSVEAVDTLIAPDMIDGKAELLQRYPTIRKMAPEFLSTFVFRGHAVAANLLRALSVTADLYRSSKRNIPDKAPISFAPKAWMPLILEDGKINRRAYEFCLFSELKRRLDAGDVWVEGSKRFQSFESFLIPTPTFELMREEGPLPIAVETDVEAYLQQQRMILNEGLRDLSRLAEAGELDDVELTEAGFNITPHRATFPDIAKSLKPKVEARLPAIRITDLILEVDARTGFSNAFTHLRTGRTADNRLALLTAVLADGINLGLTRMADVSPGLTMRQLAWAHDWHIREEGYSAAQAILINAQRQLPLSKMWGDGTTSSSDGQYFQAGGYGEALGDLNARYGPNPGAKFYRFTSDQYGAFYIIVMNANASEAIHVLDGLLYHGSDLAIETHYVDTGGVSDMSFALCHLLGFQLVPRLRGLKDRRLYLFPGDAAPENLEPLVGEPINVERIKANWNDILRLVTTIRSGQVRPSTLLAKLSAFPRQNGLALALRDIGRINRSIFLPQWWRNPDMRRNATIGLNKSEAQNTLPRALFFNRLGELRDRTFESQLYRASGLNLLMNAIVYWNALYLEQAFADLNRDGIATPPDVIKHIAPLGWQHISLTGDYIWTPTEGLELRPLGRETSILTA